MFPELRGAYSNAKQFDERKWLGHSNPRWLEEEIKYNRRQTTREFGIGKQWGKDTEKRNKWNMRKEGVVVGMCNRGEGGVDEEKEERDKQTDRHRDIERTYRQRDRQRDTERGRGTREKTDGVRGLG